MFVTRSIVNCNNKSNLESTTTSIMGTNRARRSLGKSQFIRRALSTIHSLLPSPAAQCNLHNQFWMTLYEGRSPYNSPCHSLKWCNWVWEGGGGGGGGGGCPIYLLLVLA